VQGHIDGVLGVLWGGELFLPERVLTGAGEVVDPPVVAVGVITRAGGLGEVKDDIVLRVGGHSLSHFGRCRASLNPNALEEAHAGGKVDLLLGVNSVSANAKEEIAVIAEAMPTIDGQVDLGEVVLERLHEAPIVLGHGVTNPIPPKALVKEPVGGGLPWNGSSGMSFRGFLRSSSS